MHLGGRHMAAHVSTPCSRTLLKTALEANPESLDGPGPARLAGASPALGGVEGKPQAPSSGDVGKKCGLETSVRDPQRGGAPWKCCASG
jgi:hypothetical protein